MQHLCAGCHALQQPASTVTEVDDLCSMLNLLHTLSGAATAALPPQSTGCHVQVGSLAMQSDLELLGILVRSSQGSLQYQHKVWHQL